MSAIPIPVEPYALADATYNLAEARARQRREHMEWVAVAYAQYRRLLIYYVFTRTEDFQLAEDISHEAFVTLCEVEYAKVRSYVKRWLLRNCKNCIFRVFKENGRRALFSDVARTGRCYPRRMKAASQTPAAIAQHNDLREAVATQTRQLRPKEETCTRMYLFKEMTRKEITEEMGHCDGYTDLLVQNGIRQLQEKFGGFRPCNKSADGKLLNLGGKKKIWRTARGDGQLQARNVVCVELNQQFKTTKEAADFAKVDISGLRHACRDPDFTAGGYHWKYVEAPEGSVSACHEKILKLGGPHARGRQAAQA